MYNTQYMSTQTKTIRLDQKSQLNVKIDELLHDELKILSIRKGKNLNEIVEEALFTQLQKDNSLEGESV